MINRRNLIGQGVVAAGVFSSIASWARASTGHGPRVVIVGGGILGVSLAYHLSMLGARVVVLDRERGPGRGCTQGAFATLIADHSSGPAHFSALYDHAVLDWRRLEAELDGRVAVQWGGLLRWARAGAASEALEQELMAARGLGALARRVDEAAFSVLAPGVAPGEIGAASFSPNYGTVDPMQAVSALAEGAHARGVDFRYGVEVRGLQRDASGRIVAVESADGPVDGDVYVLASGAGAPALAETVGARAPMRLVSGTLAHSRPHPRVLSRVLNGPEASIKQDPDGCIVTGLDYRPDADGTDVSEAYGERLLASAAETVPGMRGARLDKMTIGYVPIPEDTQPIVGFNPTAPNLYTFVSMSGITMAPLLGRLASWEIATGESVSLLGPYRPSRFSAA